MIKINGAMELDGRQLAAMAVAVAVAVLLYRGDTIEHAEALLNAAMLATGLLMGRGAHGPGPAGLA
ncbi:hypothetical protein AGRA3207_007393 [Actinomadura graeca]|uniref:Uncharacterized protein n=1 Tax=Actinomadura graeca TaxID=2750812 RepID=A0ABX8R447_9ACTN|nr:hypothetical protein [Actinomadura graeca]QXJ25832.1 hypothetical protein AGRA3207_007393 [Actinomadura graeca]